MFKKWTVLLILVFAIFLSGCDVIFEDNPQEQNGDFQEPSGENPGLPDDDIIMFNVDFKTLFNHDEITISVPEGETFTAPDVVREGYTFIGWYLSDDEGTTFEASWDFDVDVISSDMVLYAQWEINQYEVIFNLGEGHDLITIKDDFDTVIDVPMVPEKEGHTFIGWSPEAPTRIPTENITVTAQWEINNYTLTQQVIYHASIDSLSLGNWNSSLLTTDGRLYVWGAAFSTQISMPSHSPDRLRPQEITRHFDLRPNEHIKTIALGGLHHAIITTDDRVFTWGNNQYGELGNGTWQTNLTPTDITEQFNLRTNEVITLIMTGSRNSAALSSQGRVFTWGENEYGQIGDGTKENRNLPTDITSQFNLMGGDTIIDLSFAASSYVAVSAHGRVYTWGGNNWGQLGDETTQDRDRPTEITSLFNLHTNDQIIRVQMGASHGLALSEEGKLYAWGANWSGQLGHGTFNDLPRPTNITEHLNLSDDETILHMYASWSNSAALTSKHRVLIWGSNEREQIGNDSMDNQMVPLDITERFGLEPDEYISSLTLGYDHIAALTSHDRLFTWGNNENGQLGNGTQTNNSTPEEMNLTIDFQSITLFFNEEVAFGTSVDLGQPTRDGYTFDGWYLDRALTEPFEMTTMPAEHIILYGAWVKQDS